MGGVNRGADTVCIDENLISVGLTWRIVPWGERIIGKSRKEVTTRSSLEMGTWLAVGNPAVDSCKLLLCFGYHFGGLAMGLDVVGIIKDWIVEQILTTELGDTVGLGRKTLWRPESANNL